MLDELQMLRARVLDLESQFQGNGKSASAPMIYEKEQVGFAFKGDALEPLRISNYEEGFEAQNAIRAPLTSTGQTIGSMYIEANPEKSWDLEEEQLANTVAQQASLQIQSLRLLASAERARTEAEEATRSFMHESWASYLDAIHQNERIGYAYDQASVTPFLDDSDIDGAHRETVKVMDEQVGTLALKNDPSRPLTDDDKKLAAAVANQIAQQVENIRLLADASRARAEAEEATRRLTHESWQGFAARRKGDTLSFAYDTVKGHTTGRFISAKECGAYSASGSARRSRWPIGCGRRDKILTRSTYTGEVYCRPNKHPSGSPAPDGRTATTRRRIARTGSPQIGLPGKHEP